MAKIVIKMEGGLGNQLLQYLFGLSLSKAFNYTVYYDISEYVKKRGIRKFALKELNLPGLFISCHDVYKTNLTNISLIKVKDHNFSLKSFIHDFTDFELIKESSGGKLSDFKDLNNSYLIGHWVSFNYWHNPKELVKELNENLDTVASKRFQSNHFYFHEIENCCAIHVRRGDYLRPEHINWFGVCSIKYYEKAIEVMNTEKVYFFSDDVSFIDSSFVQNNKYINASTFSNNEIDDFLFLRKFNKLILSNSTFSYLAGILSTLSGHNAEVIAPYPWYRWGDIHPPFLPNWKRFNCISGNSEVSDIQNAMALKISVISLGCKTNHEINETIETLTAQSLQPIQIIFIISDSERHNIDFYYFINKFTNIEVTFTALHHRLHASIGFNLSHGDHICIHNINEFWTTDKLFNNALAIIKLNSDVVISPIRLNISTLSENHIFNNTQITDINSLIDNTLLSMLILSSSVFFRKQPFYNLCSQTYSPTGALFKPYDLIFELAVSNLNIGFQNISSVSKNKYNEINETNAQLTINYLQIFELLLSDIRTSSILKNRFNFFIQNHLNSALGISSNHNLDNYQKYKKVSLVKFISIKIINSSKKFINIFR